MKKCIVCGDSHERNSAYCSKACGDKAYRERKKAEKVTVETPVASSKPEPVEKVAVAVTVGVPVTIDSPVRLFWNRRFENEKSSCAKAGSELTFEEINESDGVTVYRVRRGKRNFFANSKLLAKDGITI